MKRIGGKLALHFKMLCLNTESYWEFWITIPLKKSRVAGKYSFQLNFLSWEIGDLSLYIIVIAFFELQLANSEIWYLFIWYLVPPLNKSRGFIFDMYQFQSSMALHSLKQERAEITVELDDLSGLFQH